MPISLTAEETLHIEAEVHGSFFSPLPATGQGSKEKYLCYIFTDDTRRFYDSRKMEQRERPLPVSLNSAESFCCPFHTPVDPCNSAVSVSTSCRSYRQRRNSSRPCLTCSKFRTEHTVKCYLHGTDQGRTVTSRSHLPQVNAAHATIAFNVCNDLTRASDRQALRTYHPSRLIRRLFTPLGSPHSSPCQTRKTMT